jgi:hypothetical protein
MPRYRLPLALHELLTAARDFKMLIWNRISL